MIGKAVNAAYQNHVVLSSTTLQIIPTVQFQADFLKRVVEAAIDDVDWQEEYVRAMGGQPSKHVTYEHGSLYYQGRLWIPDSRDLR